MLGRIEPSTAGRYDEKSRAPQSTSPSLPSRPSFPRDRPTPWDKEAYEEHARGIGARRQALIESAAPESEFDALFREQKEIERELLGAMRYAAVVGTFEGAMYEAQGLYRPQIDCIMFTRTDFFCLVCRRAIERIIDLYSA